MGTINGQGQQIGSRDDLICAAGKYAKNGYGLYLTGLAGSHAA